jgi:hypothetical protein
MGQAITQWDIMTLPVPDLKLRLGIRSELNRATRGDVQRGPAIVAGGQTTRCRKSQFWRHGKRLAQGERTRDLAKSYGVSVSTISRLGAS